jgi:dihydropteroate synthase
MATSIVGILNCTPDSFSDGISSLSPNIVLSRAKELVDDGADILDIGGDSTRPGSTCAGIEEEWRRIAPILSAMSKHIPCSVDTHHVEVARRAIDSGAAIINDISGDCSEEMSRLIASSQATYLFMFNAHGAAHKFGEGLSATEVVPTIRLWISETTKKLIAHGIPTERLIADPGMGAFISRDPQASWEVLSHFSEFPAPRGGLLLGCSRKGFLKTTNELDIRERDLRSCTLGARAVAQLKPDIPTYLRVHNVAMQRDILIQEGLTRSHERNT